jgi:tRNA(His) 5'-end guanylyltransferase
MSGYTDLDKRMKEFYEFIPKTKLMRRTPVILRIDGKAFHSFTRGFKKPFDEILINSMQETMKYLCENIQGCVLGYTQSDEISLLLVDYKNLNSSAWFDYEVQKLCSVSASMATLAFNKAFSKNVNRYLADHEDIRNWIGEIMCEGDLDVDYYQHLLEAEEKGAMFDARCFNIPKEEVTNYFYWRQKDASKNSVQMLGRAYFSHKELHNKNGSQIQDMLMLEKGINWNNLPTTQKRGSCCIKEYYQAEDVDIKDGLCMRSKWIIDNEIPIFKGIDRNYIEQFVYYDNIDFDNVSIT